MDQAAASDAIAVLGAAEYDGQPSPVFRARLDHARDLYNRGIAPLIIVLGGTSGDEYSEGTVGRDYLVSLGIPESAIIPETERLVEAIILGLFRLSGFRIARLRHSRSAGHWNEAGIERRQDLQRRAKGLGLSNQVPELPCAKPKNMWHLRVPGCAA